MIKQFLAVVVLCLVYQGASPAVAGQPAPDPDQEEWVQLFDGQSLEGWKVKIAGFELGQNYGETFRVEDGLLKAAYDRYGQFENRFGHIFYERPFSHYRLRVEYRFVGEQTQGGPDWAWRNSGVMVHSQSPDSMLKDQDFPISIEVQLLGGRDEGERSNANLCTPGTHVVMDGRLVTDHCVSSSSRTYRGDQWVTAEVEVLGSQRIRHILEGETVLEYEQPQIGGGNVSGFDPAVKQDGRLLEEGYISLQGESHPIEFRKVELLNLKGCMDRNSPNYKSYYVESDPDACR
jgi:hypothetical protein